MLKTQGLDPKAVRRQFERRGPLLADADFLLRVIERQMLERLEVVRLAPATIVDLGCGLANGLMALRQRYPQAGAIGVDIAEPVVRAARERLRPMPDGFLARLLAQVQRSVGPGAETAPALLVGDAQALPLAASSADLLWSNLCLHWLADPQAAFAEWHRVIRPGGLLMFSAFGVDTLRELRREGAHLMPFHDMHDLGDALVQVGFADPVLDMEWVTVSFDEPAKLLADLHALGGNALAGRRHGLAGRQARDGWLAALLRQRDSDAPLALTFEIVFGHAWCPERKRRADGLAPIHFQPNARGAEAGP